ncbi:MAG: hypothetical protein ACFHXK_02840 [bacterium]
MYKYLFLCVFSLALSFSALGFEDPTRPPADVAPVAAAIARQQLPVLSSIVYSEQRRLAVINGQVFLEGQRKGGLALVEVLPDNVLVQIGQEPQLKLHLGSGRINKEVK